MNPSDYIELASKACQGIDHGDYQAVIKFIKATQVVRDGLDGLFKAVSFEEGSKAISPMVEAAMFKLRSKMEGVK